MLFLMILLAMICQQSDGRLNRALLDHRLRKYNQLTRAHPSTHRIADTYTDVVKIAVYYESLCEDSRRFLTTQLPTAYEILEPYLDVRLKPYGKSVTTIADNTTYYTFDCQHGPRECYGNMLHACALDLLLPQRIANIFNSCLMDFGHFNRGSDDNAVDMCAAAIGIDGKQIKECANNKTGVFLLNYYGQQTTPLKLKYVPHILINGVQRDGINLMEDICSAFTWPPYECQL